LGAIDFAGGTVGTSMPVIAGFIGALVIGKRIGYGRELMPPHITDHDDDRCGRSCGSAWVRLNAGSNLEANGAPPLR